MVVGLAVKATLGAGVSVVSVGVVWAGNDDVYPNRLTKLGVLGITHVPVAFKRQT
jgi:hypothetical protein